MRTLVNKSPYSLFVPTTEYYIYISYKQTHTSCVSSGARRKKKEKVKHLVTKSHISTGFPLLAPTVKATGRIKRSRVETGQWTCSHPLLLSSRGQGDGDGDDLISPFGCGLASCLPSFASWHLEGQKKTRGDRPVSPQTVIINRVIVFRGPGCRERWRPSHSLSQALI